MTLRNENEVFEILSEIFKGMNLSILSAILINGATVICYNYCSDRSEICCDIGGAG